MFAHFQATLAALPSALTLPFWPLAAGATCAVAALVGLAAASMARGARLRHMRAALAEARAEWHAEAAARIRAETAEDDLRAELDAAREEGHGLQIEMARLRAEHHASVRAAEEKLALLTRLRDDMEARFRDLSHKAVAAQGEALRHSHAQQLKATLAPLQAHVGQFEKALKAMHESSQKDRIELRKEIGHLTQRTEQIGQDAVALARALKSDQQKQGAWGEMVLERILEESGLREGTEYSVQAARHGAEGQRLRPDVVVHLPGEKSLVIDAKVSLSAYSDLVNAEDDVTAAEAGRRHLLSLRTHVDRLAAKDYPAAEARSVDYVILFVPIEGAFSEALRLDGSLTTHALDKRVTIATPTTLMMALKTVAHVWAVDRRNRNAEEIADRAGRLYDKVAGFVDSLTEVGQRLDQAQAAYGRAYGQLSTGRGNVLAQVDRLRMLGAKTTRRLPVEPEADAEDPTGSEGREIPAALPADQPD